MVVSTTEVTACSVVGCGREGRRCHLLSVRSRGRERAASMQMCAEQCLLAGDACRYVGGCLGVSIAKIIACRVCGVGGRGEGADPVSVGYKQVWVYWGGTIIRSMDWTYVETTFTGNCEVEAGSKLSKGGCCCSTCDGTSDRAAAQRIYGGMGGGRQRQQVAKAHSHSTKQINNEIACQLYLDIPTQAHNSSHAV